MNFEKLYLEVTRECTMRCEHCLRGENEHKSMSIETLENSLKDIKHIHTLLLSGGEPLINLELLRVLPIIIKKYSIEVESIGIITNGTIYSTNHLETLKRIQDCCKRFGFFLSYDLFHILEWKKKGISQMVENNYQSYKRYLPIEKYPEKGSFSKITLHSKGRAKDISPTRIQELFMSNHISIDFNHNEEDNTIVSYNDTVEGKVCIDVNGNIVGFSETFHEEDEEASDECNVNYNSIRECIKNYIDRKKTNKQYKKNLF